MQVAKLGASGAPNAMKSDEGNDSLDTFIHQTMGKESLLSFSRTGDSPVQWIQLLNSFDQPDLLGWPLITPMKIQLQKCEKCSGEFCSPINYRRHIRMHRRRSRSLNVDKESHKSRDLLGSFWDNLSLEDAKNVASFEDISLKEISGSSVVIALANALRKPGVWTMPQSYVKAGSVLLEIVQAKYFRLPISSQELFIILDDASERTFLCAGTAESVQKFIIDGGAEEALEMRNLVASVSLLFEQKLVRAWLANKDAESLRCQKLLVEEEEAAEKRRSQLLERRKQKQLRQQEQKSREQSNCRSIDNIADSADSCTDSVDGAEISVSQVSFDNHEDIPSDLNSFLEPSQLSNDAIVEARSDFSSDQVNDDFVHNSESWMEMENGHPPATVNGWQVPKSRSQRSGRNGFYGRQNLQTFKVEPFQKQGLLKDRNVVNSGKVWTRKSKSKISDASSEINLQKIETNNIGNSNSELLIGSITVPVRSTSAKKYATEGASNACSMDLASSKEDNSPKEILKSNSTQAEIDQTTSRFISICPTKRSDSPVQSGNQHSVDIVASEKVEDTSCVSRETCLQSCPTDMDNCGKISHLQRNYQPQDMLFSSDTAKAFLAQRWKDAISAHHVKLVLSHEAPRSPDGQNDSETQLATIEASVAPIDENTQAKFRRKAEKGTTKTKYILKQKL
ncbi:hypothetical protein Leryth_027061 [Lithospermum erythrorhizon]|nr:hypothetical protein Leryth_027061 [Lithospermum erythrorhizon]